MKQTTLETQDLNPYNLSKKELLRNIERLTSLILDRLEVGSRDKRLDAQQARFLGSIALRSMRLWTDALSDKSRPRLLAQLDSLNRALERAAKREGEVKNNN